MDTERYRVMLINPPVINVLEGPSDQPRFLRAGIAYIAGYLRQDPQIDVSVIDAKFERLDFQQVLERVLDCRPHVVGFGAFTNEVKPAAYQAGLIKRELPETTTVIGGIHVTALPEPTLAEFPTFDLGVVGEGEITFRELCDALRRGASYEAIPGLVLRRGSETLRTLPRDRILDQDSIPYPAWDLFPPAREYWVQTLRGCPFDCSFCMNPGGRVARGRSVANVLGELKGVTETYNPDTIWFGDELFSVDMLRIHALCDAMIEADLPGRFDWFVQTHVRFVDYELFKKMKAAGVRRVDMGVETGDEKALGKMGKGTNLEMIRRAGEAARKAGVPIATYILFGQPNETPETVRRTIELAVQLNPESVLFGVMLPFPGTEVGRMAVAGEGGYRLKSTDWDDYRKALASMVLEFSGITRRELDWLQLGAYLKLFVRNGRFWDLLKFIWTYKRGAITWFKKLILGRRTQATVAERPEDYDRVIDQKKQIELDDVIAARAQWKETQIAEMRRARAPHRGVLPVIHADNIARAAARQAAETK